MDKIEEIEARLKAATPGPWEVCAYIGVLHSGELRRQIVDVVAEKADGFRVVMREDSMLQTDLNFIAHAPEDIEFLLTEVKRLQDVIKGLLEDKTKYDEENERLQAERDAAIENLKHDCNICKFNVRCEWVEDLNCGFCIQGNPRADRDYFEYCGIREG